MMKKKKRKRVSDGDEKEDTVSIIIPMHNAEKYIGECLESIAAQKKNKEMDHVALQVSIYDDSSTDGGPNVVRAFLERMQGKIEVILGCGKGPPCGAGGARNRAVRQSTGNYLCFIDADDAMYEERIARQLQQLLQLDDGDPSSPRYIVGSGFTRVPEGATAHYMAWCNSLTEEQLHLQQFRECTIIQPTWFMRRLAFDTVGGYKEKRPSDPGGPIPSDLLFFQDHLKKGGRLSRVPAPLLHYRHVQGSVSGSISWKTLFTTRLRAFEQRVLCAKNSKWTSPHGFLIWGAGRDGKMFLKLLHESLRKHVRGFIDVDQRKIERGYYNPRLCSRKFPVYHFSEVKEGPFVVCVAMNRTQGQLEHNIRTVADTLHLEEGSGYWHFA